MNWSAVLRVGRLQQVLSTLGAAALGVAATAQSARAQCGTYTITQAAGGAIVPGTADVGNHCDGACTTQGVPLPFPFTLYGVTYNSINISNNGDVQFGMGADIFAFLDWQSTADAPNGQGVFTSTTGAAPNRRFHVEYRTAWSGSGGAPVNNFEIRLIEGSPNFDVIYGNIDDAPPPLSNQAVIGVQSGFQRATLFSSGTIFPATGTVLHFIASSSGPPVNDLWDDNIPVPSPPHNHAWVGSTFLATSRVVPGCGPASTGLAVSLDATAVDAGTIGMHDDGLNGDAWAGDGIYSALVTVGPGAALGEYTIVALVADDQGRSHSASATVNVTPPPPPNSACSRAVPAILGDNPFDSSWCDRVPNACNNGWFDEVWYTLSIPTAARARVTSHMTCACAVSNITLYDTDCNTSLACSGAQYQQDSFLWTPVLQANHIYKLRIGSFSEGDLTGSFNVSISSCGSADFNCDGDTGTDADIQAFFACLAGSCPPPPCTSNADFNGDGEIGTDADIESFFRVLAGGSC